MRSLLAGILLAASCGSDAGGLLVVTVDAIGRVPAVASFRVVATNGSAPSSPIAIPVAHGPADIPPAQTFALAFDASRSGAVHVAVDALGSDGATIASGTGDSTITPGQETMATVLLGVVVVGDMGGDAAVDGAAGDMRSDAAVDGSVVDLRQIVPPDLAPSCATTLAGIGGGDFTIRFRITTKATAYSEVLFQRSTCDATMDLWDVVLNSDGGIRPPGADGLLTVFVNHAGTSYAAVSTATRVNDGLPHDIVIRRQAGALTTTTDGVPSGGGAAPQSLGSLPPLGIATGSPCASQQPLNGTVTNVCLTVDESVADMGADAGAPDLAMPDLAAPCGVCTPGQQITMACGNCGTATATCTTACQWSPGACNGQGACAPGATQGGGCDQCSQQTCGNNCQWSGCALQPGNSCEWRNGANWRPCTCTTSVLNAQTGMYVPCSSTGMTQNQPCTSGCFWATACYCGLILSGGAQRCN